MKKTIAAALCALFLLSMAGCGTGKSTGEQTTAEQSAGTQTTATQSTSLQSTGTQPAEQTTVTQTTSEQSAATQTTEQTTATQTTSEQSAVTQPSENNSAEIDQLQPPGKGQTIAIMKTNFGDIKIKFFPKEAPKAVENFIGLSKKGYYNNLIFHRVIKDFMIQGGDPTGTGTGGQSIWGKEFEDEFSPDLHNFRGALSMANGGPNTNGSQFFIVQAPKVSDDLKQQMQQYNFPSELIDQYMKYGGTPWLDNMHTVFGQVFEGMDVVDKITTVEVDGPETNKPLKDVKILSVEITTQK
jgi:peptidyl-prolyl cis-trans isomerase B (cyclophilin B)